MSSPASIGAPPELPPPVWRLQRPRRGTIAAGWTWSRTPPVSAEAAGGPSRDGRFHSEPVATCLSESPTVPPGTATLRLDWRGQSPFRSPRPLRAAQPSTSVPPGSTRLRGTHPALARPLLRLGPFRRRAAMRGLHRLPYAVAVGARPRLAVPAVLSGTRTAPRHRGVRGVRPRTGAPYPWQGRQTGRLAMRPPRRHSPGYRRCSRACLRIGTCGCQSRRPGTRPCPILCLRPRSGESTTRGSLAR